jgi:hypothetical protein
MTREPDYRASDDPALQPYRDKDGNVVTLTPDQCGAIFRAMDIWLAVADPEARNDFLRRAVTRARQELSAINTKSCLMARILYDGKAPLVDPPPTVHAAPDYSVEVPR